MMKMAGIADRVVGPVAAGCALLVALLAPMAAQAGTDSWTLLGPQGGGLIAFVFDPTNAATIYAGTAWGAVFKSTDAGASWAPATSGIVGATVVFALAIAPTNANVLYAGTDVGIWKSVNGGASWISVEAPDEVGALAIDPTDPATVYAGSGAPFGLVKTTDGGATWTEVLPNTFVASIVIDPAHPATLYVGSDTGGFKTVDGGATWTAGIPDLGTIWGLALDPAQPGTLYAGCLFGVYKTTDGGATWNAVNTGLPALPNVGALAVDPRTPGTVYAANGFGAGPLDLGVYKSTDGGATWTATGAGLLDSYVYGLAIDPTSSAVYAATASGASKSTDGGASWSTIDAGLSVLDVTATVIDPTSNAILYAGTDLNGVFKSADGGATWAAASNGIADSQIVGLGIDPVSATTLYAATIGGVFKSVDSGASWREADSGLPLTGGLNFDITSLTIDPSRSGTFYVNTDTGAGTWKTSDGGNSWTRFAASIGGAYILLIDPSQTSTMYATGSTDVEKSTDGGATWLDSSKGLSGTLFDLVLDPAHPATLYAATSQGFFRSADAGASWTPASCGLPSAQNSYAIAALAVDPRHSGTVYAGGRGIFRSADGGTTWTDIGSAAGLAGIAVQSLTFDAKTSTLYAGTVGRSLFAYTDSGAASPPAATLCIDDQPGDARFAIQVHYQTQQGGGQSGDGRAISLAGAGVADGGLFWFFDATNPEMLVKVIDGCAVDNKFWLFYSAGTNVGLTTTVVDHATGETKTYANPDLTAAPPVQDTAAFDCAPGDAAPAAKILAPAAKGFAMHRPAAQATVGARPVTASAAEVPATSAAAAVPATVGRTATGPVMVRGTREAAGAAATDCSPGATTLCIGGRFKVETAYQTVQDGGQSGMGQAIALDGLGVNRGGLFWFFSADNPEMLVKVVDGCTVDGKYWVFYSAATNVGLKVTVTDTQTGAAVVYTNPDLTAAPPVQDTGALPCS